MHILRHLAGTLQQEAEAPNCLNKQPPVLHGACLPCSEKPFARSRGGSGQAGRQSAHRGIDCLREDVPGTQILVKRLAILHYFSELANEKEYVKC